ncbi:diguanylate cyclase, partial [Brasilonema sp. CT11]|nr:diguanylate cyclase [Brasilonema sp. CT11]
VEVQEFTTLRLLGCWSMAWLLDKAFAVTLLQHCKRCQMGSIEIAKAIRDIVQRPGDLVARYGGEEFAVILPNTDVLGSTGVAQRICFAIQRLAIPHQNSLQAGENPQP